MTDYSSIIIFNNEGQQLGYDRRCFAKLSFHTDRIRYGCSGMSQPIEKRITAEDFDEIAEALVESMRGELKRQATAIHAFSSENAYRSWLKTLDITERDVSWAVLGTLEDGRRRVLLCTDGRAAPVELDDLEKLIRKALNVTEVGL